MDNQLFYEQQQYKSDSNSNLEKIIQLNLANTGSPNKSVYMQFWHNQNKINCKR